MDPQVTMEQEIRVATFGNGQKTIMVQIMMFEREEEEHGIVPLKHRYLYLDFYIAIMIQKVITQDLE